MFGKYFVINYYVQIFWNFLAKKSNIKIFILTFFKNKSFKLNILRLNTNTENLNSFSTNTFVFYDFQCNKKL